MDDLKRMRTSARASWRVLVVFAVLLLAAPVVALAVVDDRGSGSPVVHDPGSGAKAATTASAGPPVQAWSSVIMDRSTGYVLYKKDPNRHLLPASCTKIMTAMLVLEHVKNLDQYVTVPRKAMHLRGALLGLHAGDRITVRNLLLGLMVKSATDCAVTLATRVSGNEPRFAVLMNKRAAQLGLANTHYVNSSGQAVPGHHTSARDLAELGRVAMRNARFRDLAWRVYATVKWPPNHVAHLHSHNIFNETFDWVDGIKTGATRGAGCVLVASGKYHNRSLIVVTMHEPKREQEFKDALKLYEWADALYGKRVIVEAGAILAQIPVDAGGQVDAVAGSGLNAMCRLAANATVVLKGVPQSLAGPPAPGTSLGTAVYYADGGRLGAVPLVAP